MLLVSIPKAHFGMWAQGLLKLKWRKWNTKVDESRKVGNIHRGFLVHEQQVAIKCKKMQ
jgi:hypothetical protein